MRRAPLLVSGLLLVLAAACSGDGSSGAGVQTNRNGDAFPRTTEPDPTAPPTTQPSEPVNVYEHTEAGELADSVRDIPTRVYVPKNETGTVDVIDPATFEVVDSYPAGRLPQHVVPSWDMQTLYVNNNQGNSLTPIDPRTGRPGPNIPVDDPYNLYFTPDGTQAMVIAERNMQVDFRNPRTWELIGSVEVPHAGVNHVDFSADGKYAIASCEFSGWVVKIDIENRRLIGELEVGGEPIDVKLSPDGTVFYVANQTRGGVSIIDPNTMTEIGFVPTGAGAHGLYPSRDATKLYVSNRLAGSVTVIDFATRQVVATWAFGGSPDMGGVSTDGSQLWLSGRYHGEVYVIDTNTGQLVRRIQVGGGPHGLAIFPQPGRFSMGHTGNFR